MMRKKIILVIAAVIFLAVLAVVFGWLQATRSNSNVGGLKSGPQISVEPEFYDLGTVIYGEVARHSFTVKNTGAEPLEIFRLSTSCGCTQAEMKDGPPRIAAR